MKIFRNISVILLSLTYFVISIGLGVVTTHYCHDGLSSITYLSEASHCECGDDMNEMACCSTIQQYVQFSEDALALEVVDLGLSLLPIEIFIENLLQESTREIACSVESISWYNTAPKYILFTSLILYA